MASLHRYGDHPSQLCELYGESESVAVLIHGGFWRQRYGRELEGGIARDLVARGWAVWNIEYRRLGNGGGVPATLDDVSAAMEQATAPGVGPTVVRVSAAAAGR